MFSDRRTRTISSDSQNALSPLWCLEHVKTFVGNWTNHTNMWSHKTLIEHILIMGRGHICKITKSLKILYEDIVLGFKIIYNTYVFFSQIHFLYPIVEHIICTWVYESVLIMQTHVVLFYFPGRGTGQYVYLNEKYIVALFSEINLLCSSSLIIYYL